MVAEVPLTMAPRKKTKQKNPQEKLDEFWNKFTTKAPGKATAIIPQNPYAEKAAKRASSRAFGGGQTTQASYEEAAAVCKAKVAKIIKECRRVNQRYRDPHFDLEFDLKLGRRDCLDSLDNEREIESGRKGDDDDVVRREQPQKDRAETVSGSRGGGILGLLSEVERENDRRRPGDGDMDFTFRPQAVKRVPDIFDSPQFYIDGPTANDVRQGRDGDCWLMAALCTLSNKPGLIEKICVDHDPEVGVYGFVFHRDGEWFSEIIDDKLYLTKPDYDEGFLERILWEDRERVNSEEAYRKIYQSNSGALYFAQCENPNETWLPLLEKAYAKAHGDYSAIEGGFTGEGIEDLTGGVTSEIYTTDILDKEHFWKEELMKVNDLFLFGCSTGVWGRGWGERKGIVELHAYSVMKAVEIDGVRLVLLKNPWGKHEWKGPWSDGSKEWTPEWLTKLGHRFGDDGSFWISYDDLLKKYQAFDRTRLFGPDWKVTSIWTTLSVPWTLEYHDTKFAFTLAKAGPVVLVLSQLDERYFKGLEGQYRFELSFRLHKAGEDDYVVRSQTYYRMNRSVNVELDLEAGDYTVLVKIDAQRDDQLLPPEEVVRANAKQRREKLIRIGLAYDLAHSKGKIIESAEEKVAREAYEKRKRDKLRKEYRKKVMEKRHEDYYLDVKHVAKERKRAEKKKAKKKERIEKKKAEREAKLAELKKKKEEEAKEKEGHESKESKESKETEKEAVESKNEDGEKIAPESQGSKPPIDGQNPDVVVGPKETKGQESEEKDLVEETKKSEDEDARVEKHVTIDAPETDSRDDAGKDGDSSTDQGENTPASSVHDKFPDEDESRETEPLESDKAESKHQLPLPAEELKVEKSESPTAVEQATSSHQPAAEISEPKEEAVQKDRSEKPSDDKSSEEPPKDSKLREQEPLAPSASDASDSKSSERPMLEPKISSEVISEGSSKKDQAVQTAVGIESPMSDRSRSPFPPGPPGLRPRHPGDLDSDSDTDDDLRSISSVSEISDRELDIQMEQNKRIVSSLPILPPPPSAVPPVQEEDEFEKDPWNAVIVVGLRLYYKVADEDKDKETVTLRVERPNPYADDDEDEVKGKKEDEGNESKVLDVDDSAKDATLDAEEAEKKTGILPEDEAEKIDGKEPEIQTQEATETVDAKVEAVRKEAEQEKTAHDEAVME
ncbi:putative calpain family cysteine protease protein [Phaeoacremonium minimum UCRPA7]|uniref:Putative calpain family cysteine protease protein n=1 Tax=Phaeoacremonium minimum (strain UCR-PA7) TaxID=1286976 RepID=R8BVV9_PHAM7|nr:putative calpain family cysteine protease protein [Phaeoacremonium minimum UCRPA7]EOO03455.1 putative calpain family cysteine protease protein [Phaeoacremonium minimum UCRPA7]